MALLGAFVGNVIEFIEAFWNFFELQLPILFSIIVS